MSAEAKVRELGLDMTATPAPVANYVPAVRTGNLVFLSGHIPPVRADGTRPKGKLGADVSVEDGYQIARSIAVALLVSLRTNLGTLDSVLRVVKVLGMVNATPGFEQQSMVVNGASDLLVEVFGDAGKHARSAVGVGSLPLGVPVEIEMIVEVSAQ